MARRKIVAGNWKMNLTREEGMVLLSEALGMIRDEVDTQVSVVFCTPFPHLSQAQKHIGAAKNIFLGAQNCSHKASGAYTGEVSAAMLKSFGVDFVIVGHSERREHFQESNAMLAEKVNLVLANGMAPVFCCGESLQQRQNENFVEVVCKQLTESLFHLSAEELKKVVIAYEPIWAIGTGLTATAEQAEEMHFALRQHFADAYTQEVANDISILYGGSCNAQNAPSLFACPNVDGGLVGGASLKSREFTNIAKSFQR